MNSLLRSSLLLGVALSVYLPLKAQLKLGDNPTTVRTDAILELNSTNQGLLFPRVLKAQITGAGNLAAAPDGMMVYVTDTGEQCFYVKKAGAWMKVGDFFSVSATSGLTYNATTGALANKLGDINITSPATGQVLQYQAGKWVNWTPDLSVFNVWATTGNTTNVAANFLGTTNLNSINFRTNNVERGRILTDGRWSIGGPDSTYAQNSSALLMVKSKIVLEGSGPGSNNEFIFTKASTGGVNRIADDNGDFQIQGGNNIPLALGASQSIILYGDRNNASYVPTGASTGTGVFIPAQRDVSVALGIQANSASQTGNLTEWRNNSGTVLSAMSPAGSLGIGVAAPARNLHVAGTMRLTGTVATTATSLLGRDGTGDITSVTTGTTSLATASTPFSFASNVLNINNTAALWNANQLQGIAVAASPAANTYLKYDGTSLVWSSVTGMPSLAQNNIWVGNASSVATPLAAPSSNNQLLAYDNTGAVNWVPQSNFLNTSLASTKFWLGNASGVATQTAMSGDATMDNTGKVTIANNAVNAAKLANGAVGLTQLANGTNSAFLTTTSAGVPQWTLLNTLQNTSLNNGSMWLGDATNTAVAVTMSGDATITNAGVLNIAPLAVTTGDLAANAVTTAKIANSAVGLTQLANGTNSSFLTTTAAGVPQWTLLNTMLNTNLASGKFWLGNASGVATQTTMSGDVKMDNAGVTTIQANAVVTNDIADKAVTATKLDQMSAVNGQTITWNTTSGKWVATTPLSSVALTMPSLFSVTGSPLTANGTIGVSLATQTPNTVFAGPATGTTAAAPTFRSLVAADLPTGSSAYIQNQNAAAQATSNFWISGAGKTGGTMEVGGTSGSTSGLKLTGMAIGTTTPATYNAGVLSIDGSGNVILTQNAAASNWLITGNTGIAATSFLGTNDDKAMTLKSNALPYLSFGRRATLGLTQSAYPDYTDDNEKVTYVQSALQFQADAASFYKPKMWTNSDGNFRMKGSAAGTDYFEFGSTGTANAGGFEFIIGDDGDEPILFKSYNYNTPAFTEIARMQSGKMGINMNGFTPARTLDVEGAIRMNGNAGTVATKLLGKDNNGDIDSVLIGTATNSSATATAPLTMASNLLVVNNTAPLYNANKLYGTTISSTAPTTGQLLKYDGTNWVPTTVAGTSAVVTTFTVTSNNPSLIPVGNSTLVRIIAGSGLGSSTYFNVGYLGTGAYDGQQVTLYNMITTANMQLYDNQTPTGTKVGPIATGGEALNYTKNDGMATFMWDATDAKWLVISIIQ